ncbi:MAG: mechanosensitive ion channel family protein [Bacteroidales bacterium]
MQESFGEIIVRWLEQAGLTAQYALWTKNLIILILIILMAVIADRVTKQILLSVIGRVTRKTETQWDDLILKRKVFHRLSHLAPAIIIYFLIPVALENVPFWLGLLQDATKIYIFIILLLSIDSLLSAINDIYNTYEVSKTKPIKGYIQVVKIILYSFGAIIIISILIGKSPFTLLAGLGALTAVIMLIFKDTILGLVGSVQLSANDMVNVGDWISMPDFKADGIVQEITLATVKVQNWDKTISTIPTYSMITSSFQNWRGMEESGGRRIMRSVKIDQNTIHFLTKEELEKFKRIQILGDYIERKQNELQAYNQKYNIDNTILVNGRRQTNIGILRAYLMEYLKRHPKINEEMLILVRQLEPGENGLPLQIYCFSRDQAWADYEVVQADIFDHLLATLHEFGLKVFQNPTGHDLRSLKK